MSDLRGALAISNDVHAELMEAVRDGREPARVAAAAAARRATLTLPLTSIITLGPNLTLRSLSSLVPLAVCLISQMRDHFAVMQFLSVDPRLSGLLECGLNPC